MFRDSRFRILFRFRVLWPEGCRVKGIGLRSCVSVRAGVLDHNSRIQRRTCLYEKSLKPILEGSGELTK